MLGNLFAFILARLSFFSAILRCALFCYCSCACFLGYLVNQLFCIFEHFFILVEDLLVKILSFCVFVSPGVNVNKTTGLEVPTSIVLSL